MASKELSILLVAKDMASKTIGNVSKKVGGLGGAARTANRGLSTLAGNLAKVGAVAAVGIGAAVHSGIASLAELEDATTSVDGAIAQMGFKGSSKQIADWANDIEASVQAAFDDKAIVAGAATLIRYGKVSEKNLQPTMVVMTDLAAKTGDVGSAADLLGKALANPTKASRLLQKVGASLTKDEQKRIVALEKLGRHEEAQEIILRKVAAATKGAAAASKGPYNDALNTLTDTAEDAKRALAEGFLPVIMKISDWLRTKLADKGVIQGIKDFGSTLAGAFEGAADFVMNIPWDSVMGAVKGIAGFAKAAVDAFKLMPDWAKQILIGGFVANKLTGGAVSSLVGQLASGLIKGVLGIQAGVVNVTGGVVNAPGGGLPGAGKTPGGGLLTLGVLGPLAAVITSAVAAGYVAWRVTDATLLNPKGPGEATIATNTNPNNVVNATWATLAADMRNGWRENKAAVDRVNYTVARKEWRPVINVSTGFTVSVRNVISAARVASTYNVSSGRRGTNLLYEGRNP
jgi:hypothetical protein